MHCRTHASFTCHPRHLLARRGTLGRVLAAPPLLLPVSSAPGALVSLLVVLLASAGMYWVLVRRSTSRRQWVALGEWARDAGLHFRREPPDRPPEPLDALAAKSPRVRLCLMDDVTSLVQLDVPPASLHDRAPPEHEVSFDAASDAEGSSTSTAGAPSQWNILIRRLETDWPATGVRPTHASSSLLDLFPLTSFPRLGNSERFVVYGTASGAARTLATSSVRALLPPDVGLLLHGQYVVLDFTSRPFDTIEFNRMIAVADQIVAHLPLLSMAHRD